MKRKRKADRCENHFPLKKSKNAAVLISICLFFQVTVFAQSREIRDMDFNWKFSTGDYPGAEKPGFNDRGWRTLDVPHDWSIESDFSEDIPFGQRVGYLPNGVGWYRKTFKLSGEDLGKLIRVEFDGVYMNSDVWINGVFLGRYPYGYTSFHYDLNEHLKKGENTLAVRVDNSRQPNSRWYTGSGIYRHVRLVLTNTLHVQRYGVYITTPEVTEDSASVQLRTGIQNLGVNTRNGTLISILTGSDAREAGRAETLFSLEPGEEMEVNQHVQVMSPMLWSIESPELYSLKTLINDNSNIVDELNTPFGIRSLEFDAWKGFLLNGKQVKMKGVNLHHDGGCVGAAVPEAVWVRRLKILKDMGCNAIRTAHNPVAPEFLDLCDRMGFLVMNEVFDEWKMTKGFGDNLVSEGYHKYFDEWAERDLTETLRRDRNHPSVVMWSVGNEVHEQYTEEGVEILKRLINICHSEDPSRPVTQGNSMIASEGPPPALPEFLEAQDIVGYNYVDRWNTRRELYFSIDKMANPEWKMIGTENRSVQGVRGDYSLGDDPGTVRPNYNTQMIESSLLWKVVAMNDYVMGDFMWTGIDYMGESSWPHTTWRFGVIDRCGFPKDAFYFYQSIWTEEPMIHIFPHWNWEGREGQFIPVLCYTNCDAVELFLNGKSIGEKRIEFPRYGMVGGYNRYLRPRVFPTTADLHLSWDVPYEPGTLRAVGKRNGEPVFVKEIKTSGEPARIRLSTDKNNLSLSKGDVVHITAEILDSEGNIVPLASNLVSFQVKGPGKIIATDSGDPMDYRSFKNTDRNAFHGLSLAIIGASGKKGEITVTAVSEGLESGVIHVFLE
jgi:beta-galactosidase